MHFLEGKCINSQLQCFFFGSNHEYLSLHHVLKLKNNRDFHIDPNNREYDFLHNRVALEGDPASLQQCMCNQGKFCATFLVINRQLNFPLCD